MKIIKTSEALPKSGRYVLAWLEGAKIPMRAMWAAQHTLPLGDDADPEWGEYSEEKDEYFCPAGWYEMNQHEEQHWGVDGNVVAWCELPRLDHQCLAQIDEPAQPVCWIRFCSDGSTEGPIMHSQICEARKTSGAWTPLYAVAAPAAGAPQGEYPHEQMDAMALARYKVAPSHASMLWSHAVVAGDGAQQLYVGREVECQNMARKFAGAFLDGAFAFHSMAAAPTAQAAPALEAPAAPAVPAGFALVPLRLTRAMDEAISEEGRQWEDLLAAAQAVTEEQYEASAQDRLSRDEVRAIFLECGFVIKEGQTDLKPYVYEAAQALESRVRSIAAAAPQAPAAPSAGNWIAAEEVDRLVRDLDVALHGESDAAAQASLCDIVGLTKAAASKLGRPVLAAPAAPSADEREAFEAWIKKDGGDLSTFGSGQNRHYNNSAVNNAWTGWSSRAAQAAPAAPAVDAEIERAVLAERERICAAIKAEDDHCATGDYMLDSDDCIKVARGEWVRPIYDTNPAAQAASKGGGIVSKTERLGHANALIEIISRHGRRFFRNRESGAIARLELDASGRLWWIDEYRGSRVYTGKVMGYPHRWRGFSHGGTLRSLVEALRGYVLRGELLHPEYIAPSRIDPTNGDIWGYGAEAAAAVRAEAHALPLFQRPTGHKES